MNSPNLLCLYIKAPREGQVKTRLAADIGHSWALKLYRACVEDLREKLAGVENWDLEIHYSPAGSENILSGWLGKRLTFKPQREGDLGERMLATFTDAFNRGYRQVIIIGSDLPHISADLLQTAFRKLKEYPIVLGPSTDGGYYLIGLNRPLPALFRQIPWSTPRVLPKTLRICEKAGYSYFLLPEETDLDDGRSLFIYRQLMKENPTFLAEAPRTSQCLQQIFDTQKVIPTVVKTEENK